MKVGDPLTLEYYVWEEPGRLVTRTRRLPRRRDRADRRRRGRSRSRAGLSRHHRSRRRSATGIRRFRSISSACGRVDEEYWEQYRTTPKAFVPLEVGQRLWRSRYGDRTSVRVAPAAGEPLSRRARSLQRRALRAAIDPLAMGLAVRDVRGGGLAASRGATDFGEYFIYFSFFLVVSALLLAALFFRLGVEQRAREVGLLRAVGFIDAARPAAVRGRRAACSPSSAASIGIAGAVGYGGAMMAGLRTWWVGAVGDDGADAARVAGVARRGRRRRARRGDGLHLVDAARAVAGCPSGACWRDSLAGDGRRSGRLGGAGGTARRWPARSRSRVARRRADGRRAPPARSTAPARSSAPAASLLVACLCLVAVHACGVRRGRSSAATAGAAVSRLGLRNAADRPGRSVLAIGVIASATFILISVDAFRATRRRRPIGSPASAATRCSSTCCCRSSTIPNSRDGREALGLADAPDRRHDRAVPRCCPATMRAA